MQLLLRKPFGLLAAQALYVYGYHTGGFYKPFYFVLSFRIESRAVLFSQGAEEGSLFGVVIDESDASEGDGAFVAGCELLRHHVVLVYHAEGDARVLPKSIHLVPLEGAVEGQAAQLRCVLLAVEVYVAQGDGIGVGACFAWSCSQHARCSFM